MTALGDRLSRWTPAMFACALANPGFGLALAVFGLACPPQPVSAPASLAMVHMLTIGWLTLLMLGALFRCVPAVTSRKMPSQTLPLLTLVGVGAGLALMVAGCVTNALSRLSAPSQSPGSGGSPAGALK